MRAHAHRYAHTYAHNLLLTCRVLNFRKGGHCFCVKGACFSSLKVPLTIANLSKAPFWAIIGHKLSFSNVFIIYAQIFHFRCLTLRYHREFIAWAISYQKCFFKEKNHWTWLVISMCCYRLIKRFQFQYVVVIMLLWKTNRGQTPQVT